MPDDNRLDLNSDLDKVADDFLKDVEAATKEVKQRKAADKQKDIQTATKARDRKISIVVIAAAVVALIVIASWLAFGRQPAQEVVVNRAVPQQTSRIAPTTDNRNAPVAPPKSPSYSPGNNRQAGQQPYDDEQPPQ